ncbi:MAG: hypothetical protein KGI70_00815 [Patescibacteria group bacterium]|nr:hypothetical protein [Patescibacteria group bacterium]
MEVVIRGVPQRFQRELLAPIEEKVRQLVESYGFVPEEVSVELRRNSMKEGRYPLYIYVHNVSPERNSARLRLAVAAAIAGMCASHAGCQESTRDKFWFAGFHIGDLLE